MSITVRAIRWEHGWELEIDSDHHTQSATLADAEQQVRDYLETAGIEASGIVIVPELGPLGEEVAAAREATSAAAAASVSAAKRSREAVRQLRRAGYSVNDSAAILGVSKGRISQLAKEA
ncbi:antitoxin HicB [Propionicimonas sp.]|uniref:antitoxin HicB n=1 Tax=Propionicimonas sp. TaxID=1955623 RepID=UPI0039E6F889